MQILKTDNLVLNMNKNISLSVKVSLSFFLAYFECGKIKALNI